MAFNFNWSPLLADTSRARDLLTTALNKTPKPPIIVADIHVTELNLGSTPPDLDILEIGDLAEDRFRGIFKMTYAGDAFLTLKTKVQVNPLNTYLSGRPSFASPMPLAAASGLTIPLQITLSEFRLSGFVILVFPRQKGITLVFRNDPLEGLKVSSTFDTIPFVRDYLQKEIEGQLRLLFMEDLPAIIHRLSLRLWGSEHDGDALANTDPGAEAQVNSNAVSPPADEATNAEEPINPLLTPSQKPITISPLSTSNLPSDIPSFSLSDPTTSTPTTNSSSQSYPSFSHKNLLRLAALSDSHRTLSLFTPTIRDSVYRAAASASEGPGFPRPGRRSSRTGLTLASLAHTLPHRSTTSAPASRADSSDAASSVPPASATVATRPGLVPSSASTTSFSHTYTNSSYSFSHHGTSGKPKRKRKHHVVNLRKTAPAPVSTSQPPVSGQGAGLERPTTPESTYTGSYSYESQTSGGRDEIIREGEMQTPPDSPERSQKLKSSPLQPQIHRPSPQRPSTATPDQYTGRGPRAALFAHGAAGQEGEDLDRTPRPHRPAHATAHVSQDGKDEDARPPAYPYMPPHAQAFASNLPATLSGNEKATMSNAAGGGVLDQTWLMRMAKDLAERQRKVQMEQAEKARREARGVEGVFGEDLGLGLEEGEAPPAYVS